VDYSARSVIVVGPHLKLYQCGLPKKIAMELYQPFIIRKLKQHGLADTIKSAKRMIERRDERVWDILEEVIHQHPVLLNRAPTLHRMGVQAFEPVLVEGNAIMLHPLSCRGFNADFDGDQMAVHLPLSIEAQVETHILMMTTSNIFSPANGSPMVGPSQDMVMGNYYLTYADPQEGSEGEKGGKVITFRDTYEAMMAYEMGKISLHQRIKVRVPKKPELSELKSKVRKPVEPAPKAPLLSYESKKRGYEVIETTVGRCIFNDILPGGMPFYNAMMVQKKLSQVISDCFEFVGSAATVDLLDRIKDLGFKYATTRESSQTAKGITRLSMPGPMPESP
jgi:DNA-directed RNA polymerase subunit beta'